MPAVDAVRFVRLVPFWSAAITAALCAATHAVEPADPRSERLDDLEARLRQLEDRLVASDDELRAARERLATQEEQLERAGLVGESEDDSDLARFLRDTELHGWVAASYWWNTNRPDNAGVGANRGNPNLGRRRSGLGMPFHPDHNSFQFDQLWVGARKRARADSRAGFGVDLVFGKTADALRAATPTRADLSAVYQAYVAYLAPLGPGVRVTAGRFETHLGVETPHAAWNSNVTRGLLFSQLQPITHTGLKLETRLGPLGVMAGVANDALLDPDSDADDDKALLWGLALPVAETLEIRAGGVWGGDGLLPGSATTTPPGTGFARNTDRVGVVDLVVRWVPAPTLEMWLNADYLWSEHEDGLPAGPGGPVVAIPGNPHAFAAAVGSRYAITAATAFGFRAEWLRGEDNFLDPAATTNLGHHTIWSLTGTLDHALTPRLRVRIEGRYEGGETDGSDAKFYLDQKAGDLENDQFVAGVETLYEF